MTRPNILIVMADQLSGVLFPDGPADFLHVPHLRALAARSVRYANAYTASPLCAPGRASFMSGQLPRRTRVYDNASEFASDIPTYAHHLRRAGYQTCMSGKMHFVGPDQLHGLEERLTTDIYPADFGWTPDYRKPGERIDWWYHNLGSVTGAGVAEITNQYEYDDEVAYNACRKLYDLSRGNDDRPWCLTVSFTHPHDPYVARRKYWDLYDGIPELEPPEGMDYAAMDPHSQRLMDACDWRGLEVRPDHIRRARQGYFANISYIDDKLGELMDVLERTRQEAIVVFLSDHGDMLGARGLWFKMNFFEGAARVPLMIAAPGMAPGRIETPVSTIDVLPTLCALAGVSMAEVMPWTDGESLAQGAATRGPVAMEYAAEGSITPLVCLRDGDWKYIACPADPEMLFNLAEDPGERVNRAAAGATSGLRGSAVTGALRDATAGCAPDRANGTSATVSAPDVVDVATDPAADPAADAASRIANQDTQAAADLAATDPAAAAALTRFRALAAARWNLPAYDAEVRESQARRWVVYEALRHGAYYPWDHQPLQQASERYMRNHMDLNVLEESKRFPKGE